MKMGSLTSNQDMLRMRMVLRACSHMPFLSPCPFFIKSGRFIVQHCVNGDGVKNCENGSVTHSHCFSLTQC